MMNVCEEGELVIDAKGVYSIENFLRQECLCIGRCIIIKHQLGRISFGENLERAKQLISQGIDFRQQKILKYFLTRGKRKQQMKILKDLHSLMIMM
jgi:hypothetical protein